MIFGDRIRFGVHAGQVLPTFAQHVELWRRAERHGYDWISVFDHFRPPDAPTSPCFESTTMLAAMAMATSRVRCAVLVLAAAYRNPAITATMAVTLDHISGGRLELGMGAGAPDGAHDEYGLAFPAPPIRISMLAEACTIMRLLWTNQRATFHGEHFGIHDATLEPKPFQSHLPLVIGGGGERRMLPLVARHADIWNTAVVDPTAYERKLEVLDRACRDIDRPADHIRRSILFRAVLGHSEREAVERFDTIVGTAPADSPRRQGWLVVGTPEQCVDRLRPFVALGVRDFLLNLRPPIDWTTLELVAARVAPQVRSLVASA